MRRALAFGVCTVVASLSIGTRDVAAQSAMGADIAGGYAALRVLGTASTSSTNFPRGWYLSGAARFGGRRLQPIGEVSFQHRRNLGDERQTLAAWFGGARWMIVETPRAAIFAEGAIGAERFSEPGFHETGLAIQPAGGVDWRVWRRVSARATAGYRLTRVDDATFKAARVTVGAAVRFGR